MRHRQEKSEIRICLISRIDATPSLGGLFDGAQTFVGFLDTIVWSFGAGLRHKPHPASAPGASDRCQLRREFGMASGDDIDEPAARGATDASRRAAADSGLRAAVRTLPQNPLNAGRRRFVIASAVAGIGSAAAAPVQELPAHDGELGAPPQSFRGSVPWQEGAADAPPGASGSGYVFFEAAEAAFIEAAVARLIPNDPVGPGAVEAGVPFFLDRQLAGRFGRGEHYFLGGPWPKGTPEQGYQSRFSPGQYYRAAIAAIDKHTAANFNGAPFWKLTAADQDALLKGLEDGKIALDGGVEGKQFFDMLLQNTKEGYFSDPVYGGNKDMAAWKMIGFPGAHYDYKEWVQRHGERVPFPQVGMKGRPGWMQAGT
jgi:gluconate 2-dehydrogenase gamma chain